MTSHSSQHCKKTAYIENTCSVEAAVETSYAVNNSYILIYLLFTILQSYRNSLVLCCNAVNGV